MLIDLSHPIRTGMPVFPGDPHVALAPAATLDRDGFAVTGVSMGSHSGTHVDAPSHSIAGGRTMSDVRLDRLIGPAAVLDARGLATDVAIDHAVVGDQIAALPSGIHIVLIATGWDRWWGDERYLSHPFVAREVAETLRDAGVDVLGTDTLNPDRTLPDPASFELPVHEVLLGADRLIIENLRGLGELLDRQMVGRASAPAVVDFLALPIALDGADGAPVRAAARL